MKKLFSLLLVIALVLSLCACSSNNGNDENLEETETVMTIGEAVELIGEAGFESISSDYATIKINENSSNDVVQEGISAIIAMNNALGFSGGLYERMTNTRGIDGVQSEENDYYKISWSFSKPNLR